MRVIEPSQSGCILNQALLSMNTAGADSLNAPEVSCMIRHERGLRPTSYRAVLSNWLCVPWIRGRPCIVSVPARPVDWTWISYIAPNSTAQQKSYLAESGALWFTAISTFVPMSSNNPRGRQAADISAAFTGISGVVVVLRLYTRFFLIRYAGIEDYLVALAMVSDPQPNPIIEDQYK